MLHFLLTHTFGLFSNTMTDINLFIFFVIIIVFLSPICIIGDIGFIFYLMLCVFSFVYVDDHYSPINSYSEKPEIAYNYLHHKSSHYGTELQLTSLDDNIKDFNFNPDNKTIYQFNIIKQKWGNIIAELKYYEKNGDKLEDKKTLLLLDNNTANQIQNIIQSDNNDNKEWNKELIQTEQNSEKKAILKDLIQ